MATTDHHEREDGDEVEDLPLERHERGRQDDHANEDEEPEGEHDPELERLNITEHEISGKLKGSEMMMDGTGRTLFQMAGISWKTVEVVLSLTVADQTMLIPNRCERS